MDYIVRNKMIETGETDNPLDEILYLLQQIDLRVDCTLIQETHRQIGRFFSGSHPDFKPSNTKYHNLSHTYSVALATIRIFHGLYCEKQYFDPEIIEQGMVSAYFHDTGLLVAADDPETCGAKYTTTHEERSISFMNDYLAVRGVARSFRDHCADMVKCTNLGIEPDTLTFVSESHRLAGYIVGSADLLAQMADRFYLERLPLLFQEMNEGGVNHYASAIVLMRETNNFYQSVVRKRLEKKFRDLQQAMQTHFRERWNLDQNLYVDNITKNINYIAKIISENADTPARLPNYLRRNPPA